MKRVLLETRELFFRAKLTEAVKAGGAEVSRDAAACDLAVVELSGAAAQARVVELVGLGVAVLAYGSHVRADLLRAARDAGAVAVPNSEVEATLRGLLTNPDDPRTLSGSRRK